MNLCVLCARTGKTCCQLTDILLTGGDLRRIQEHLRASDFFEFRPPRDPTSLGEEGDPNWLVYTLRPDGTRRVLRHIPGGDCWFLTPTGCSLPGQVRPLICRLHPANYTEAGLVGLSPECPSHLAPGQVDLLAAVGMNLESARLWHRQLYEELRDDLRPLGRAA